MELQRYGLVLAGLLIIALGIVAVPVSAYDYTVLPDDRVWDIINSTGTGNAPSVIKALAAAHSSHAPGAIPGQADPVPPENAIVAAPDLTLSDSIGPHDSLQAAINAAADGGTLWLDPGIYSGHDIIISKNIIIRSNASAGGNRYNTIIDAQEQGRIFSVTGAYSLSLDNLTLRNATLDGGGSPALEGGAILAASGSTVFITSVSFIDCSITGSLDTGGGAICSYGMLTITSSSFEDCSAIGIHSGMGGAILGMPTTTVTASSFNNCTATGLASGSHGLGGAISYVGTIVSSSFEDCTAAGHTAAGGAVFIAGDIVSSSFRNCSATGSAAVGFGSGGAVFYVSTVTSSSFENCSVTGYDADGGAIGSLDTVITSSSFTSCAAAAPASEGYASGGAIYVPGDMMLSVTSTRFTDCTTTGHVAVGGAIYNAGTVSLSSFDRCAATGSIPLDSLAFGGAIYSPSVASAVDVTSTRFTDCSATGNEALGGAIFLAGSIESSTFTRCTATGLGITLGGAIVIVSSVTSSSFVDCSVSGPFASGGAIYDAGTITSSAFSRCSANGPDSKGGAICTNGVTVTSASFTGCSATDGGAIASFGRTVILSDSTFSGCTATGNGGAVYGFDTPVTVDSAAFSGCTAAKRGGAIATGGSSGSLSVTSSSFFNCGADGGGAIYSINSPVTLHFSRIYRCNTTIAVMGAATSVNAENNWWGTNNDPSDFTAGVVDADPWLVLGITADPSSITVPQTSSVRTNLSYNSDGTNTAGGGIYLPDAIPNAYAVISGPGIVSPATAGSVNGVAQTTYITLQSGTTTIAGTVDDQTVYITLDVAQGSYTPAPTEVPHDDDDWPAITGSSAAGGSSATGSSGFPLMTVTVNIGGDSKAWQAIVTGTKLSDLIVTGTVQSSGAGGNFTVPPGIVFQYISLVPARYDTITNTVINFTVPQSWLEENHIDPKSIVLYRQTANGWEALPTTVLYTKDGTVYFSAQSGGFSLFAIAGMQTVLIPPGVVTTQEPVSMPAVQEQAPAPAAVAKAPGTTQTTAQPASSSVPAGSSPFPVFPALIGIGCVGLIGGGWYIRRWWIQRQNPALYAEYE